MPGKIGVKIKAGRNLPVMDRGSETTDAYVEIKLGGVQHKTDVCRKSLNPQWNTDWFRFEVDDAELQDEPLQIRLMDHDTYSANDAIGKVNISLNPLCLEFSGQTTQGKGTVLSGWIPVFDTMHGIRGEVNVIVKVDLFSDVNKFRQSSCGIPFFHSQCIPYGYRAQIIHGFVEELVVNDDPEYQWIDKIRTPRASNEARQVVFLKLSGQVQRKMGLKAINMGANAVIGYTQCFDLEGDVGVVARGIGTAVTLIKDASIQPPTADNALIEERTIKYLEFLTGVGLPPTLTEQPEYKLEIRKSRSATLFDLTQRSNSFDRETFNNELILDLIRQEDERGEKKAPKKLRHHMQRSRNMLNEKYVAFKRRIGDSFDSRSSETSRSLSSLFASGIIKEESTGTTSARSSMYDVRKKSFKAKHKQSALIAIQRNQSLRSAAHPIVRSVSDDSAMKQKCIMTKSLPPVVAGGATCKLAAPKLDDVVEFQFQDNTRSSPNICSEEQKLRLNKLKETTAAICSVSSVGGHELFGQFSKHEPHKRVESVTPQSVCSSNSLSLSDESSSNSSDGLVFKRTTLETNDEATEEDDDDEDVVDVDDVDDDKDRESFSAEYDSVERAKLEKMLQICNLNDDERDAEQWIQPGKQQSVEDSLPGFPRRRHSLLHELKAFSQHIQDILHMPLMAVNIASKWKTVDDTKLLPFVQLGARRCSPPTSLSLKCLAENERRKSYYSSQPEILIDSANTHATLAAQKAQSRSLTCLAELALDLLPVITTAAALRDNPTNATTKDTPKYPSPIFPILQICPSTPTPSESDNSQLSPTEIEFIVTEPNRPVLTSALVATVEPPVCVASAARTIRAAYSSKGPPPLPLPPKKIVTISSKPPPHLKINTCKNSQNNRSNLIAKGRPKINTNTNHCNINPSLLLVPCSTTTSLLCIKPHPPIHHRSLNELNATTGSAAYSASGISESPGMKRFASPASAAVAASAAATTGANAMLDSRNLLSPSPSKLALTVGGGGGGGSTPSQSDSISSTTTASTATTIIPKEMAEMCRRSSDSDLSVTPKGNSFCVASERLVAATAMMRLSQPITGKNATTDNMDMLEYPFLTMTKYPPGFILHLGATVAARSVKLLERVPNPDEPEVRDSWWTELRMEIRSHARALGCNVVLGYSESTTISDDVCVLSATGTAAVINMGYNRSVSQTDIFTMTKPPPTVGGGMSASLEERDIVKDALRNGQVASEASAGIAATKETIPSTYGPTAATAAGVNNAAAGKKFGSLPPLGITKNSCAMCHVPYNLTSVPLNVKMKKCALCRKGRVPDVLLATLEVPEYLQVTGRGCFMQAQVVRAKKDLRSELNAKEISDGLPFLEYELHRVLINKLKAKGMNAIFGLKAQVAIGERMIALIATGTALFLSALPVPQVPKIVAGNSWTDKQKLNELQKKLQETFERNQEIYQLKCMDPDLASLLDKHSDTDESDDEAIDIDLNCGNKDTCVLEVDDIEDLEIISLLMEPYPPEGFHVVNTQMVPGMVDMEAVKNLQMFTQVWRAKLDVGQNVNGFPKHFQRLLQTIYFKLRTMIPCAICDLRFRLDLPESDQIQLLVTGMALGLGDANKFKYRRKTLNSNGATVAAAVGAAAQEQELNGGGGSHGNKRALQEEDYIFPLDEDQMVDTPTPTTNSSQPFYGTHSLKLRKTSPSRTTSKANAAVRNRYFPLRDRYGVDITPLSFIPGGKIDKYLGNLNFFFIRESTSIRENGGISGFVHGFITELLAVVRAHISALGGNAMVSFYMNELILVDNQHKNQGQCLISIGGDAVSVSYYSDD